MSPSSKDSEVLAYCGSCKMDLMATVVARTGGKIVKVLCNTCKKERAYKAPKGVSDPTEAPAPKKKKKDDSGASEAKPIHAEWQKMMALAKDQKPVAYSIKMRLEPGLLIKHPTFGDGVVIRLVHPNKAEVMFSTDIKLLIHVP